MKLRQSASHLLSTVQTWSGVTAVTGCIGSALLHTIQHPILNGLFSNIGLLGLDVFLIATIATLLLGGSQKVVDTIS